MARTGKTVTTYRGQRIVRCNWEEGRHQGKWYIQTYHSPTGMPWADEACPHFDALAGARDCIKTAETAEEAAQWAEENLGPILIPDIAPKMAQALIDTIAKARAKQTRLRQM